MAQISITGNLPARLFVPSVSGLVSKSRSAVVVPMPNTAPLPTDGLYLDERFARASTLVRELLLKQGVQAKTLLVRRSKEVMSLKSLWNEVPKQHVVVPTTQLGEVRDIVAITATLPALGTEPVSLLRIPADIDSYLVGRRKQALRTNVNRAKGFRCTTETVAQGLARTEFNIAMRTRLVDAPNLPAKEWPVGSSSDHIAVVGRDAAGTPVALAVARKFGSFAILETFFRLQGTKEGSACRSLVHVALVRELHKAGVRYFSAGGAFRLEPGLQYLQYLQGFEPAHLRLEGLS